MYINVDAYLADSLAFKPGEDALRFSFAEWLPDDIIDCHAHAGLPEHIEDIPMESYCHPISTFPSFTIEQSERIKKLFYPNRIVRSLRFAMAFRGVNHRKANQYLLDHSPRGDRVALFGLSQDVNYTKDMLCHPRVAALKMYHSNVTPPATLVYQYFRLEILSVAERCGVPIILHLPRPVTESMEDLKRVAQDFPRLKIVIAHLGPTDFLCPGLEDVLGELADYPHIYMDTSLNNSKEVIELVLRLFGASRIMHGSDEPLNMIRGKVYLHPKKGNLLITEYPYHWVNLKDHARFAHLTKGIVHWHWLSLVALREAVSTFPAGEQDTMKKLIFYENAQKLFGF